MIRAKAPWNPRDKANDKRSRRSQRLRLSTRYFVEAPVVPGSVKTAIYLRGSSLEAPTSGRHQTTSYENYCRAKMLQPMNNCNTYELGTGQFSTRNVCVITNCAARKAITGRAVDVTTAPSVTSLSALARGWVEVSLQAERIVEARNLYAGRAFREGRLAAEAAQASLFVVSAGFGLVSASTLIPNYNLTVSDGRGSIRSHLRAYGEGPAAWWRELNLALGTPEPLSELIACSEVDRVLLAMPSTYLTMVAEDLASLPERLTAKLQIFTSPSGLSALPRHLRNCVLPYDERLEVVKGFAGTNVDFPQRALRHFVQVLSGHLSPTTDVHDAIKRHLREPAKPPRNTGAKASDSEIQRLLLSHWKASSGSSTKLLRFLRDEAQVACEQKRFQRIWHATKTLQPTQ